MPNLSSPLGTPPGMPVVRTDQLGKAAGLSMTFGTMAALNAAVVADRADPLLLTGQPMAVATEAAWGVYRVWDAVAQHARTVALSPGLRLVLGTDDSAVLFGTGRPAAGTGANTDVYVDWGGNAYYTKAAGTWALTGKLWAARAYGGSATVTQSGSGPTAVTGSDGRAITVSRPDSSTVVVTAADGAQVVATLDSSGRVVHISRNFDLATTASPAAVVAPPTTPPASLPAYVPAAGAVTVMTTSNGLLGNAFGNAFPIWFDPYMSAGMIIFSGGIANPYLGQYGSLVWRGGGHGITSNNGMVTLEFGTNSASFRSLVDGTPIVGNTAADGYLNDTNRNTSLFTGNSFLEYSDGQPASNHTFGDANIIGPEHGGALHGTYYKTMVGGVSHAGFNPSSPLSQYIPHKVDITAPSGKMGYTRAGTPGPVVTPQFPFWSAFCATQRRIYTHVNAIGTVRWLDLNTGLFSTGSGAPLSSDYDSAPGGGGYIDGYVMLSVPEKDLCLFADSVGGHLRIRYMPVGLANPDPSWVNAGAQLSSQIPTDGAFNSIAWVAPLGKLIVGTSQDTGAVYEIDVPTNPAATWTVTRAPLPSGQTIPFYTPATGPSASRAYKLWSYLPALKCLAYFRAVDQSVTNKNDTLYLYRPRGT